MVFLINQCLISIHQGSEYVLAVILRLVMGVILVAWELFGTQTLSVAMPIPTNMNGLIEYTAHPFWLQKYCPSHEIEGMPRCCSCQRMEQRVAKYVSLDDGCNLCLECLDAVIMDTTECQPLP